KIINAVKRAYIEEIAGVERQRRIERHKMLKSFKLRYSEVLKGQREMLKRYSEMMGSDKQPLMFLEKANLSRLYHDLRTQRVQLRLERTEAETLLARRKNAEGNATDSVRLEIARLEDRLAIVMARQKVLDEELERVTDEMHRA